MTYNPKNENGKLNSLSDFTEIKDVITLGFILGPVFYVDTQSFFVGY